MKDSCPDLLLPETAAHTHRHQLFRHADKGADGQGRVAGAQPALRCRGRIRAGEANQGVRSCGSLSS